MKSKRKNRFRLWWRRIHLWMGLIIGLPLIVISLSGAVLTWKPEIEQYLYQEKITKENRPFVSVSKIKEHLNTQFPEGDFRTIMFRDSTQSVKVLLFVPGTYYYAYLNPYTGSIIHLQNMKQGWLNTLVPLHRNLGLGKVGREIVHWITLITLLLIISGLYLWWPQMNQSKQGVWYMVWRFPWQRLNFEWHKVWGFYTSWILLFIVGTGLFWGFEGIKSSLKTITQEDEKVYQKPISVVPQSQMNGQVEATLDRLAIELRQRFKGHTLNFTYPHQSEEAIHVTVGKPKAWLHTLDHYYFDQYSGEPIKGVFHPGLAEEQSTYVKLNSMVYDIHFGSILGWPGRILVFVAAIVCALLPITGFLIWRNRKKTLRHKIP